MTRCFSPGTPFFQHVHAFIVASLKGMGQDRR